MSAFKSLAVLLTLTCICATSVLVAHAQYLDPLGITIASSKATYYIREPVNLFGNFSEYGLPVPNGLVGVSVYDPFSAIVAFRTLKIGQIAANYPVDFVGLYPSDGYGVPQDSFYIQNMTLWVKATIKNYDTLSHPYVATFTLFDANSTPLGAWQPSSGTLDPGAIVEPFFNIYIPAWAKPGNATICACIFSDVPKDGGIPYCEERRVSFEIKRNPEIDYSTPPMANPLSSNGTFLSVFKLSPESRPGDYRVDVSAKSPQNLLTVQNSTKFSLVYAMMPPQAAFTYYPVDSYVNMSITFDASASTAEGYNVSIQNYGWNFGDNTTLNTALATTLHIFKTVGNYLVTLNVTDTQGLWCTTSKIITILPPTGPKADFIWYPSTPKANQSVTFDANTTRLGWNGTGRPPIVAYTWNFGDSNITSGYYPTIVHKFATEGNYTVKLNITDASGFTDNKNHTVMVKVSGITGDINGDGIVDIYDAILLSSAYGSSPGQSNWDPRADFDSSGTIDIFDAIVLAVHYGEGA